MALPYDTNELLKRSKAMLDQTKEQGSAPFAGSSYDTPAAQAMKQRDPIALASFTAANPGLSYSAQDIANYNTTPFDTSKINAGTIQNLPQAEQQATAQQKAIADYNALQNQYSAAAPVTTAESDLQTKLADIKAQSEQGLINTKYDIRNLPQEGISANAIAGRGKELTTEEARRQEILASQETQLSTRLGIEQNKRKDLLSAIKDKLSFKKEEVDMQAKIQDAIEKQNKSIQDAANQLSDNARQTLTSILSSFKGIDFQSLDQNTQLELQKLGVNAGVPAGMIEAGMKAVKDQIDANNLQENRKIAISQQNANRLSSESTTKNNLFTKSEVAKLDAGGLSESDATDIYRLISQGHSLEEIRQGLRDQGKPIRLLDTFDRVIGISKILGE